MDEGHKLTASIHGYSLHHKWEVKRIW
jgi:hypothetical protein